MRYLLLGLQKTGTRLLCDLLSSHPALKCPHEYLDEAPNQADWHGALDRLGSGAIGHANRPTDDMLTADACRVVLTRDPVESALSFLRVVYEPSEGPWKIPRDVFRAEVEKRKRETMRLLKHSRFTISYEDLTAGKNIQECPPALAADICRIFGVEPAPLRTNIKKNRPSYPLNWKELA